MAEHLDQQQLTENLIRDTGALLQREVTHLLNQRGLTTSQMAQYLPALNEQVRQRTVTIATAIVKDLRVQIRDNQTSNLQAYTTKVTADQCCAHAAQIVAEVIDASVSS